MFGMMFDIVAFKIMAALLGPEQPPSVYIKEFNEFKKTHYDTLQKLYHYCHTGTVISSTDVVFFQNMKYGQKVEKNKLNQHFKSKFNIIELKIQNKEGQLDTKMVFYFYPVLKDTVLKCLHCAPGDNSLSIVDITKPTAKL